MKKIILFFLFAGVLSYANAQDLERQDKTLFEELTSIKKRTDKFNLYLNTHSNFDMKFQDGFQEGGFHIKQLRIEAKGQLNNWLSYRYRQRLNRSNDGSNNVDNAPTSIDYAGIGVQVTDKFSFFVGKQCAAYGGIEFDLNPIEIYEYSDMIEYMSNFMTGINLTYSPISSQQIQLQILNSLNGKTHDTYGYNYNITTAKLPLVYTLNWNGNFNDIFETRWSASAMNETKNKWMFYYAFGNQLTLGNFNMFTDVMYSNEDIDRKGIITGFIPENLREYNNGTDVEYHNAFDARYLSIVTKLNYRFLPKWNGFVQGMYETASVSKETDLIEKGNYRTSWGYLAGIEFYPMQSNLHFFLTYIGRSYKYTERARLLSAENSNYSTNRISVGFIYQLPLF